MVLTIDTGLDPYIQIILEEGKKTVKKKIKAERKQSEKLLPAIVSLLAQEKISWDKISGIKVSNVGGSFTSLRIGVLTANALAYALKVPISSVSGEDVFKFSGGQAVKPHYGSEPNIGPAKKISWG